MQSFHLSANRLGLRPVSALITLCAAQFSSLSFSQDGHQPTILEGHTGWVTSVTFSPDGAKLASGDRDGAILLWDVQTRQRVASFKTSNGTASSLAFSPDGRLLASAGRKGVRLWELQAGVEVSEAPTRADGGVTFSPDGKQLAVAGQGIRVFHIRDGQLQQAWEAPIRGPVGMRFTADRLLWTGDENGSLRVWNTASGEERTDKRLETGRTVDLSLSTSGLKVKRTREYEVLCAAFSLHGGTCALAADDHSIEIWTLRDRRQSLVLKGHEAPVWCLCFSRDAKLLASGSGGRFRLALGFHSEKGFYKDYYYRNEHLIRLWDLTTGAELATLQGHQSSVLALDFSATGNLLASGSKDKKVMLWDLTGVKRGMDQGATEKQLVVR